MFSKSQSKFFEKQFNKITDTTEIEIRIRYADEYGYGEEFSFTDWYKVGCAVDEIDQFSQSNYPFGTFQEGDVILLFPTDTIVKELEDNFSFDSYEIRLQGVEYNTTNRLQKMGVYKDKFLYYVLNIE